MKSIFIVTEEQTETRGHGDYGKMNKLSTYGGYDEKLYPAFNSEEEAQNFIDEVIGFLKPKIMELPIWNGNLKWVEKQSTFTYNGETVTRTELSINTILGKMKVYESVDGKVFYHFLGDLEYKEGNYILRLLGQVRKEQVSSLQEGISICEEKWTKVKGIINSI